MEKRSTKLYLMRHGRERRGEIVPESADVVRENAEEIKKDLGDLASRVRIYSSPLRRAVNTSKILQEVFEGVEVEVRDELDCNSETVGYLVNELKDSPDVVAAILVSHQPDLEAYTSRELRNGQFVKEVHDYSKRQIQ